MSKLVQCNLVDSVTGEYTNGVVSKNGLTLPNITGLEIKVSNNGVYYGICDDSVTAVEAPALLLNAADMGTQLAPVFAAKVVAKVSELAKHVIGLRTSLVSGTFHSSEITAGLVKYQQAELAIVTADDASADIAAPQLAAEAKVRGITTKALAAKVIANYTELMNMEAAVAGYHGKLLDQINALVYVPANLFDNFIALGKIDITAGWTV